ncbi:DUF7096 domain-containing protein [Halobaculum litoreum]|nr:hypothetical protein [Halobaculum sp. DT92]
MRAIPVLLAALLMFAAVGVGTPATHGHADRVSATGDPGESNAATSEHNATGTLRVLGLNGSEDVTAEVDVVPIDAGMATDFGANASARRIETIALRDRIEGANTSDERQRRILDGLNEVEKDVITLHSERRTAIAAYSAGETTARQLLVTLAELRAEAVVLDDRAQLLGRLAEETPDFTLGDDRVTQLEFDLRTFDGPVRSRTAAALAGERGASTRVYVAATESGVTLATVTDGEYVRETFREDLRNRDQGGVDELAAQNVTVRSYPEISAAAEGGVATIGSGGTYISSLQYGNGSLTAFVDGGSERVFMEHQRVRLAGIETGPSVTRTLDLTLRVNRTFPGGPLRVEVVDPRTGEPVDAVVKIQPDDGASTEVGSTGADGVLWTVSPQTGFVVTVVEVGSTDVSFRGVDPVEPTTVADTFGGGNASASIATDD